MATLLIVEDDKQTNEAICEYLKSAGHKIVPAYDGAEAIQIFTLFLFFFSDGQTAWYAICDNIAIVFLENPSNSEGFCNSTYDRRF